MYSTCGKEKENMGLVGKREGKTPLGRPGVSGIIILKCKLEK
jgi:hypothetical protein